MLHVSVLCVVVCTYSSCLFFNVIVQKDPCNYF